MKLETEQDSTWQEELAALNPEEPQTEATPRPWKRDGYHVTNGEYFAATAATVDDAELIVRAVNIYDSAAAQIATLKAENAQLQSEFLQQVENCNLEWAKKREAEQANERISIKLAALEKAMRAIEAKSINTVRDEEESIDNLMDINDIARAVLGEPQ